MARDAHDRLKAVTGLYLYHFWKELVAAAESVGGIEYFLIEQEGSRLSEFETVKKCLENWKAMFEKV